MNEWNRSGSSQFNFNTPYTPPVKAVEPKKRKAFRPLAIAALAMSAALVGGIIGSSAFTLSYMNFAQPAPVVVNNSQSVNWVTGAAAEASPSVVTLSVSSTNGSGSGSGVILTEDGYILTNAHVVTLGGMTENAIVTVRLWDGLVVPAELVGFDSVYDLAVIKVEMEGLKTIKFADSSNINVGENVVAIGAPLGLTSTVTEGIVSALNRTIQVASSEVSEESGLQFWTGTGAAPISIQVIQTDAAINPGNSGGALVNEFGELIGINVAIATAGNGEAGSIGVGFAIPSNTANRIASEIIELGYATHGLLGALVRDNTQENSSFSTGAYVEQVTDGGAAAAAGVRSGDVVVSFGGQRVNGSADLTALVRAEAAGASVEMEVLRGSTKISFDVTLGDASDLG
ncbi:MAG: trypsin-like peptidase domain-containing protein, partial [Aquiluna sp.]|jgi:putative serine protease PepD|uniref:S1C family serine protease n=1 Tax=Aquiluna sp. TaxID=2053504 RepID=UPI00274BB20E|nr:trypsin-like peptidase domain-containing protein [Aquiluna sp.]MDP4886973.1 trypsin-like peptidase domain-containing protein [Aquiluna sp.]MDP5025681.1 trypsin-like peptidase domain-containing protein [Aquiluna sp.]